LYKKRKRIWMGLLAFFSCVMLLVGCEPKKNERGIATENKNGYVGLVEMTDIPELIKAIKKQKNTILLVGNTRSLTGSNYDVVLDQDSKKYKIKTFLINKDHIKDSRNPKWAKLLEKELGADGGLYSRFYCIHNGKVISTNVFSADNSAKPGSFGTDIRIALRKD